MLPAAWIYGLGGCSKSRELLCGLDTGEVPWERWADRDESSRLGVITLKLENERMQEHPFHVGSGFSFDLPHAALMAYP